MSWMISSIAVPSSPSPGSSTCTLSGSSPRATACAREVVPSEIAPTFWPAPVNPRLCALAALCSVTPSLVMAPTSTAGLIVGRTAATQDSPATASTMSYGTTAWIRPACGRARPETSAKSAELPSTVAPRPRSCCAWAAPTGPSACSCRSMAPSARTGRKPADSVLACCADRVVAPCWLIAWRIFATWVRTRLGTLDVPAAAAVAVAVGAAVAGPAAASAGTASSAPARSVQSRRGTETSWDWVVPDAIPAGAPLRRPTGGGPRRLRARSAELYGLRPLPALDQERGGRTGHPGEHDGGVPGPGQPKFAAQRRGVDRRAALLHGDGADPAGAQQAAQPLQRERQHLQHGVAGGERRAGRAVRAQVGDGRVDQPGPDQGSGLGDQAGADHRAVGLVQVPAHRAALGDRAGVAQGVAAGQQGGAAAGGGQFAPPQRGLLHLAAVGHPLGLGAVRDQVVRDAGRDLGAGTGHGRGQRGEEPERRGVRGRVEHP